MHKREALIFQTAPSFPDAPRFPYAKQKADEFLLALGVRALPFPLADALRALDVRIFPYAEFARVFHVPLARVIRAWQSREGRILVHEADGTRFLVYNDLCTCPERIRWTIAHEIAHLLFGHLRDYRTGQLARAPKESRAVIEREAHACAAELLAPACILFASGATTIPRIHDASGISWKAAFKRAHLFERIPGPYYFNDAELQLCRNFCDFIRACRQKNARTGSLFPA